MVVDLFLAGRRILRFFAWSLLPVAGTLGQPLPLSSADTPSFLFAQHLDYAISQASSVGRSLSP